MVKRRVFTILPPTATLLVMVVLSILLPNRPAASGHHSWTRGEAQAALDAIPSSIGSWRSETIKLPRPAAPLLGSQATMARRYVHPSGDRLDVLAVQCADVRDLLGHYPPACYPSVGWQEQARTESVLSIDGRHIPVRVYTFSRLQGTAEEDRLCVLSALILPDGRWTTSLPALRTHLRTGSCGDGPVGQIQLVSSNSINEASVVSTAVRLLGRMPELLDALGASEGSSDG